MSRQALVLVQETLTRSVIGAFHAVYNELGEGFLESVYAAAMTLELSERGHVVKREVGVRVSYKGREIAWQRLDMVVDDILIVELKAGAELHKSAKHQLVNYLRATDLEVGLVLHFGQRPTFIRCVNQPRLSAH